MGENHWTLKRERRSSYPSWVNHRGRRWWYRKYSRWGRIVYFYSKWSCWSRQTIISGCTRLRAYSFSGLWTKAKAVLLLFDRLGATLLPSHGVLTSRTTLAPSSGVCLEFCASWHSRLSESKWSYVGIKGEADVHEVTKLHLQCCIIIEKLGEEFDCGYP